MSLVLGSLRGKKSRSTYDVLMYEKRIVGIANWKSSQRTILDNLKLIMEDVSDVEEALMIGRNFGHEIRTLANKYSQNGYKIRLVDIDGYANVPITKILEMVTRN